MAQGGLVLEWHDCAAKEWGSLIARLLTHSSISYQPSINSSTVQEERTGDGAQREVYTSFNCADTGGESQGGVRYGWTG